jgi:DNA-binding response OmpR family regulator
MAENRQTILLVDDDLLLCRSLARNLKQRGFDVVVAHSANECFEVATSRTIDMILLDWILPDRDGVALLRDLREAGITVPVIMLTGETAVTAKVRAFDQGADDYLVKPFVVDELIARVDAHIRRRSGTFSTLRVGRVAVDTWKQMTTVDGAHVDLTPLEFSVLSFLIRNAEQVVPQQDIIDAVWRDKRVEGSAKALHIQVTRLRRKLGSAADQIETVRGTGFRFSANQRAVG